MSEKNWERSETPIRKPRKVGNKAHGFSGIGPEISKIDQCPECCSFETRTNEIKLTIKCFDCGVTSECDTLK
jgi:hypothetical protein